MRLVGTNEAEFVSVEDFTVWLLNHPVQKARIGKVTGALEVVDDDYVLLRGLADEIGIREEHLDRYGRGRLEIKDGRRYVPVTDYAGKLVREEREEYEAKVVRAAKRSANTKMVLKPIDLMRGGRHEHPDIQEGRVYLARIRGSVYVGTFNRRFYGWSFSDGYGVSGSHQYDTPGTNCSGWEGLWVLPKGIEVDG